MNCNRGGNQPFAYSAVVREEIALEGLDGLILQGLWVRLISNYNFTQHTVLDEYVKRYVWKLITCMPDISFFILPKPRQHLDLKNELIIFEDGNILEKNSCVNIYPTEKIQCDSNGWKGSSCNFKKTVDISVAARKLSYEKVTELYGDSLVMIANQAVRNQILGVSMMEICYQEWNIDCYVMLEKIARSRLSGCLGCGMNGLDIVEPNTNRRWKTLKILQEVGLIEKQIHTIIQSKGRNKYAFLYHHRKFFNKNKTKYELLVDEILGIIQESRNKICVMQEVEELTKETPSFRRKFFESKVFLKSLKKVKMLRSELMATESPWERPKCRKGTQVVCFVLNSETNEESCPSDDLQMVHSDNLLSPCSFQRKLVRLINSSGPKGVSICDVQSHMGVTRQQANVFCEYLLQRNYVFTIMHDKGRVRSLQYISRYFFESSHNAKEFVEQKRKLSMFLGEEKVSTEEPGKATSKTHTDSMSLLDDNFTYSRKGKKVEKSQLTVQSLTRRNLILEELQRTVVIDSSVLYRTILQAERDKNHTMDARSFHDILDSLESLGLLKIHNIEYPKLQMVSLVSVTEDHPLIISQIELAQYCNDIFANWSTSTSQSKSSLSNQQSDSIVNLSTASAKFPKLRDLHLMLHYLTWNCDAKNPTTNRIFGDSTKWKMSPRYKFHNAGWLLLIDLMNRLPLRIYSSLFNTVHNELLMQYLNDMDNQFIPIGLLPIHLKEKLIEPLKLLSIFKRKINSLVVMGLVQYGPRLFGKREHTTVYVNKNAVVYESEKINKFSFDSMEEVYKYWLTLETVCLGSKSQPINHSDVDWGEFCKEKSVQDVENSDTGYVYGDKKGAGGLDTSLCSYCPQNWNSGCQGPSFIPILFQHMKTNSEGVQKRKLQLITEKQPTKKMKLNSNMTKRTYTRTKWLYEEDQIIMSLIAAFQYLFPCRKFPSRFIFNLLSKMITDPAKTADSCKSHFRNLMNLPSTKEKVTKLIERIKTLQTSKAKIAKLKCEDENNVLVIMKELVKKSLQTDRRELNCDHKGQRANVSAILTSPVQTADDIEYGMIYSLIISSYCGVSSEECEPYQIHLASQMYPITKFHDVFEYLVRSRMICGQKKSLCVQPFSSTYHLSKFFKTICRGLFPLYYLTNGWNTLMIDRPIKIRHDITSLELASNVEDPNSIIIAELMTQKEVYFEISINSTWTHKDKATTFPDAKKTAVVKVSAFCNEIDGVNEVTSELTDALTRNVIVDTNAKVSYEFKNDRERCVYSEVLKYAELGTTAKMLESIVGNHIELKGVLKTLENAGLVLKVGVTFPRWISHKYIQHWTASLPLDTSFRTLIKPWIRSNGTVNRSIFDRLLTSLLSFVLKHPGSKFKSIVKHFNDALLPVWVYELLEILIEIKCVYMSFLALDYGEPVIRRFTGGDIHNNDVYYEASIDAISRLVKFIGEKSYAKEFLCEI